MTVALIIFAISAPAGEVSAGNPAVKKDGWEKLYYDPGLFGLSFISKVHEKSWDKMNSGGDLFGLPQISGAHARTWENPLYVDDHYGLPHVGVFQKS